MVKTQIIVSINVHEKPEYLLTQLSNIKEYLILEHKIILNCNDFMFAQLKNIVSDDIILNPIPINKRRFHGSLTQGVVSNLEYSIAQYDFNYFLVMSSREFFHKKLESFNQIEANKFEYILSDPGVCDWHWPSFKQTKLLQYIFEKKQKFSGSAHEGLCFNKESCIYLQSFLNDNLDIKQDIFNFPNCVEEFALQSICCNKFDYFYLGNGVHCVDSSNYRPESLTHKRVR